MVSSYVATDAEKGLVFSFLEFLAEKSANSADCSLTDDQRESLEVSVQCLSEIFDVSLSNEQHQKQYSSKPVSLLSLYGMYLKKKSQIAEPVPESENAQKNKELAESWKLKGNDCLNAKNFKEAIEMYTKAITLDAAQPIYYCNRAAAYSMDGEDELAVEDCEKAIELDPTYAKAYSRLGLAYLNLKRYDDAVSAYKEGLKLDPSNASLSASLNTAQAKASAKESNANRGNGTASPPGNMDFSKFLNDPNMMNMARNLMSSGALNGLMQNPNIASMAQNMFGQDPSVLQNMLSSLKGDGNAATSPPSEE